MAGAISFGKRHEAYLGANNVMRCTDRWHIPCKSYAESEVQTAKLSV